MSLADELLEGLSAGMNSRLADMLTEPHIVIGEDRFIFVPDELKRVAVQYDHRVETVTFDCPRFWDGYDMSKMKIYINYTRADGLLGMYLAENVFADEQLPNIMHFDWTLTRNVTGINGPIVFMVCVKRVDRDGNEEVHWNSERNTEMYISEGLEGEEVIQDLYPDIFTQMLQRMDELETLTTGQLNQIEGIHKEFVATMEDTKNEVMRRADEMRDYFDQSQKAFIDRTDAVETLMIDTQTMVKGIEKVATPEAMQNYTSEFLKENPDVVEGAISDLYYANNSDIDDIIGGNYVEVPDISGDEEDGDMIITDKEIGDIIDDLFDGDDGDNDDVTGETGGVTEEDLDNIIGGVF